MRKPDWAIVYFRHIPHLLHLRALRQALLRRAIAGDFKTIQELALRSNTSRSTVTRFFSGQAASIDVALAILEQLKLQFEDACKPVHEDLLAQLKKNGALIERSRATFVTIDPLKPHPTPAQRLILE